jgi:hypothetical protein
MSSTPSSSKSAKANKARASKRAAAKKSTNKEKEVTTFDDDVSDSIPPSIGGHSAALPGATQTVPEHKGAEEHDNASVSTMRSGSSLTSALSQAEMFRIDSLIILFNDELPGVLASLAQAETDKVDAVDFRAFQAYKAMCSRGQTSLDVTRPAESASATDKGLDFWSKMSREPPGGN